MRTRPLKPGGEFIMNGNHFTFVGTEDDTAIVYDHKRCKQFIYGLKGFTRVMESLSYEVITDREEWATHSAVHGNG